MAQHVMGRPWQLACTYGRLNSILFTYLLAKPVNGDGLARKIITVLSTELGVAGSKLLACMRDGASVNRKAMNTLRIMYPKAMNVICFSPALDLVGSTFATPNLDKFMKLWPRIFQHSSKAKLLWREKTGKSFKSYSPTRWWSKWECQKQMMLQWGEVPAFLAATDVAPKSCQKFQTLLQNFGTKLLIELAVMLMLLSHSSRLTIIWKGMVHLFLYVMRCYHL